MTYHEGDEAVQLIKSRQAVPGTAAAATGQRLTESSIEMAFGDFFRWIKQAFEDVVHVVVEEAENVYRFICTIGEEVYHVVLDCVNAVVHAVEFVFNKIKTFFEDLIKWLGFIFQWGDILRTHNVMKNIFNQYVKKSINNLGNTKSQLETAFTGLVQNIDQWAGIPDNIPPSLSSSTAGSLTAQNQPNMGQNSPQSNWGMHHLKSNAADGSTTAQPNSGVTGDIESLLQPLVDVLSREEEVLQAALDSIKSDIIDKIQELSLEQLLKALVAIMADSLLKSVENVLLAAIDIFIALSQGSMDVLNATIDIPVISWLYKQITGNDLSLLDLICLVAAIPATIGYKLIANAAPFPDNATTTALINAPDFASIQRICNPVHSFAAVARTTSLADSPPTIDDDSQNLLGFIAGWASLVGAGVLAIILPLSKKYPESKVFPVLNFLLYLPYAAPDIFGQIQSLQKSDGWAIANELICDVMVVKTGIDMGVGLHKINQKVDKTGWDSVAPYLDASGNIAWQIPTIGFLTEPVNQNMAGALSAMGGTCFDATGWLSPALAKAEGDAWVRWLSLYQVSISYTVGYLSFRVFSRFSIDQTDN